MALASGGGRPVVTQETQQSGFFLVQQTCRRCGGAGSIVTEECTTCTGRGVVRERKSVKVDFPSGVDDGMTLRVVGEGNAGETGPTGHLLVKVKVTCARCGGTGSGWPEAVEELIAAADAVPFRGRSNRARSSVVRAPTCTSTCRCPCATPSSAGPCKCRRSTASPRCLYVALHGRSGKQAGSLRRA